MQIPVPHRGQLSSDPCIPIWISTAGEPGGYFSAHVQRISSGYAMFTGLKTPLLLSLRVTRYFVSAQLSWSYLSLACCCCSQAASQWHRLPRRCWLSTAGASATSSTGWWKIKVVCLTGCEVREASLEMKNVSCEGWWEKTASKESHFPHKQKQVVSCFCFSCTTFQGYSHRKLTVSKVATN